MTLVADVGDLEHCALFGAECESTLGVGGGAQRSAFHADGDTGQGFALSVHHGARHLLEGLRLLSTLCRAVVFMGRSGGLCADGKKKTQREGQSAFGERLVPKRAVRYRERALCFHVVLF